MSCQKNTTIALKEFAQYQFNNRFRFNRKNNETITYIP